MTTFVDSFSFFFFLSPCFIEAVCFTGRISTGEHLGFRVGVGNLSSRIASVLSLLVTCVRWIGRGKENLRNQTTASTESLFSGNTINQGTAKVNTARGGRVDPHVCGDKLEQEKKFGIWGDFTHMYVVTN